MTTHPVIKTVNSRFPSRAFDFLSHRLLARFIVPDMHLSCEDSLKFKQKKVVSP